jgi:cytoskeletal protein RodZ
MLFGALWLVATAATGAVAWGAVRLAGEQTAEQAVRPMTARQVEALAASSTTATASATTGTTRPVTTSTASTSLPATTTARPAASTSTAPAASTSTSTAAPAVVARQTRGGTVMVNLVGGRLSLVSASPAPGYSVEVEGSGPAEVVVVFEGAGNDEVRVRAVVVGGEVVFEVTAGGEDG